MVKVSIIIPIYNIEKYIKDCLESVVAQTLEEIEIICVDDGSTDESLKIIKKYSNKDERIKIINSTKNMGVSRARNIGLEASTGQYIFYIDGDDWIEINLIENLYKLACEHNADVVLGSMTFVWEKRREKHLNKLSEGVYDGKKKIKAFQNVYDIDNKEVLLNWNICGNLFRRDKLYIQQMKLNEKIKIGEDMAVFLPFILNCDRIYVSDVTAYYYRQHESSAMHRNNSKSMDYYYLWEYLKPYLTDKPNLKRQIEYICCMGIENDYVNFLNLKKQNFFMFPYELVSPQSRIVIFGAGLVGQAYYRQLISNNYCKIELIVDNNYDKNKDNKYPVVSPSLIKITEYDYVVISLINKEAINKICKQLIRMYGVPKEKIITCVPKMITDFIDFA